MIILFYFSFVFLIFFFKEEEWSDIFSEVVYFKDDIFDDFIVNNFLVLVMFYVLCKYFYC